MKSGSYRRFTPVEVALHGLQALIYLPLFTSGTVLLLQRSLGTKWIPTAALAMIHRTAGIALVSFLIVVFVSSLIVRRIRIIWSTAAEALRWRMCDLIWLFKIPLHLFFHGITLPPSGRYNAGQKLNILVVMSTLAGLSVSGIWIMCTPSALAPWIVHLAFLIPAAILLTIHLYLAIVNPPTRKAITGMVTGYVSDQYMREHHPLCLKEPQNPEHVVHLRRRTAAVCAVLAAVLVVPAVFEYGPQRLKQQAERTIRSRGMLAFLPASLTRSHFRSSKDNCRDCHALLHRPPSQKCLNCHPIVRERMLALSGYHGRLTGPCSDCHKEHQGADADVRDLDKETFDHRQAAFQLDGKHTDVACEQCHTRPADIVDSETSSMSVHYIGLAYETCRSCHLNPHKDLSDSSCGQCHTANGWDVEHLTFDHNRDSRFILKGKHAVVACDKCHVPPQAGAAMAAAEFTALPDTCVSCHGDPHTGQMTHSCQTCHNEEGWKSENLLFVHNEHSRFHLDALHAAVSCNACHNKTPTATVYRPLENTCQSCHGLQALAMRGESPALPAKFQPDPHLDRVSCTDCHDTAKTEQSNAGYAERCVSCHNEDYGRLYDFWSDTFERFRVTTSRTLPKQKAVQIEAIGYHNIKMAAAAYAHLLNSEPAKSPAVPHL